MKQRGLSWMFAVFAVGALPAIAGNSVIISGDPYVAATNGCKIAVSPAVSLCSGKLKTVQTASTGISSRTRTFAISNASSMNATKRRFGIIVR